MELRPAEPSELHDCSSLAATIASSYVWQLNIDRDLTAPAATSDISISLRGVRLPRPVNIKLPGAPLEALWEPAAAVFVADEADGIIGFIVLTNAEERRAATITRIVVAPPFRRLRIGSALLEHAARWARSESYDDLAAHCSTRNHPAVAFYTRAGFGFAGFSEAYYPRGEIAMFWHRAP